MLVARYAGWIAWSAAVLLLSLWGAVALAQEFGVGLAEIAQLGPVATALVAIVALGVGAATIVQKARTDRRDQWWKRVQWGLDKAADRDDDISAVGFAVLATLLEEAATQSDTAMLVSASELLRPLDVSPEDSDVPIVLDTSDDDTDEVPSG